MEKAIPFLILERPCLSDHKLELKCELEGGAVHARFSCPRVMKTSREDCNSRDEEFHPKSFYSSSKFDMSTILSKTQSKTPPRYYKGIITAMVHP